ncbi:MAG: EF-hand domain-containing protein [Lentisphaeraceae bacterium]|nr:EF-hand domain-containing protein [Lentisphaeraceae bacterium]
MKKCIIVLAFLALVSSASAAPKDFKSVDKDKDGKISKEEFTGGNAKKEKAFKKLDKDKDDSLSEEEYKATMKEKKKKKKSE